METITAEHIRMEVKKLIAEVTEREPEEITDTALFADELGRGFTHGDGSDGGG